MHSLNLITVWFSAAALVLASVIDIRTRRIPNWLVVPFLASGVAFQSVVGGWPAARGSITGAALAAVVFAVPCFLGAMGMGDLKLAAAAGAWIGPSQMITALVVTGIAGGVIAIAYALLHGELSASLGKAGDLIVHPHHALPGAPRAASIPYAPAIAIGTLFSFLAR